MKKEAFKKWLRDVYVRENGKALVRTTQDNRVANCRSVEIAEGDLDEHFKHDEMRSLLERLSYSAEDARKRQPPSHAIPIDGNPLTGTSTYRQAINLYLKFSLAQRILASNAEDRDEAWKDEIDDLELAALEGAERLTLVRHRKREQSLRDAKVVEARKSGEGRLKCEVPGCGFD